MKIGPREQLILLIVGLLVALVAVAALLVWPQYQKQKSMDAQIATAEQQLKSSQTILSQRQEIKNRTSLTDAQWLKLSTLVPESPDLPALIIELQDAAFNSGVQMSAITPAEPIPSGDYVSVPLEIRIDGTWADTVHFLKSINNLNRGIREASFSSSVAPKATGDPALPYYSVSTSIQMQAYVIPAVAASAPATAPATP